MMTRILARHREGEPGVNISRQEQDAVCEALVQPARLPTGSSVSAGRAAPFCVGRPKGVELSRGPAPPGPRPDSSSRPG